MIVYPIIIVICMAIIAVFNILFNSIEVTWYFIVFATIFYTVLVIALDGLVATLGRMLPEKWINRDLRIYKTSPSGKKFYNLIKVKKWKDHVPELGGFTSFHKNKVEDPNNPAYLERFILEARYGVIIHYLSFPLSFLIMLIDYKGYGINLTIALYVAIVNAILILLPAFVLKYNLPKLEALLKRAKAKALKNQSMNIEFDK